MAQTDTVIATRAKEEKENMWGELDALAREVQPVNLGIGCPDFAAPQALREDLKDVVAVDASYHQYTRGFGHPRLCRALCSLYSPLFGRAALDPLTEVVVTNGATEALFVSLMGLVNPGDEVILFDPSFDAYEPQIKMAGGIAHFVPLRPPANGTKSSSADWVIDEAELTAAFSTKTKAIIINTPHNPIGKVFSRAELGIVAALCRQYGVAVISDEVYEWLTFDGSQHTRIATLPGMWDRTITIGSAGKTFSVTGWKIGWMIGPAQLLTGPKIVHQNSGYICVTPIQEALARGFERERLLLEAGCSSCYFTALAAEAGKKRDRLASLLTEAGLPPIIPQGGYFILADVRDLVTKVDVGGDTSEPKDFRFVKWLSRNRKLQGIPSSSFFSKEQKTIGENYVRFCFIKEDATLQMADVILHKLRESTR